MLKLMEESYVGNDFMEKVERLLSKGGKWHASKLVWAGDYMDAGIYITEEESEIMKGQGTIGDSLTLYTFSDDNYSEAINDDSIQSGRFFVNYDKKRIYRHGDV